MDLTAVGPYGHILASSYLSGYVPVALYLVLVGATGAAILAASSLLGPKRPDAVKESPYECGMPVFSLARQRFSVKFYLVAILFVLFDIEAVFLLPWAVVYRSLGIFGLVEMIVFVALLVVGFVYAWKRGGLDWD